jgi:CHASE2 domain-containing sensor protein
MGKRVVLKLDGELEQGFQVTLEIGEEGKLPAIEQSGYLPPAPNIAQGVDQWRQSYQAISELTRITLTNITVQSASLSLHEQREACRRMADDLECHLKTWLEASDSFKRVDKQLRAALALNEPIRVLIRTLDTRLHHLPWHSWDFIEQYTQAEVALSAPKIKLDCYKEPISAKKVRILAILGDSTGIDIETDRHLLENLPDAQVEFLVEPTRQALNHQLWEQHWHVLFFAGHSRTEGETGRLYINHTDSLTVEEVKFGLKRSIAQGLQLAIFNSCDGLGLAYKLEQLQLPHLIVMREPVPDRVAQTFLKYFLTAYSSGEFLHLAVRQGRERLQEELEPEFPCAGWLPIVCQNPVDVPPVWRELAQDLRGSQPEQLVRPGQRFDRAMLVQWLRHFQPRRRQSTVFWISFVVAILLASVRFLGVLEPLELKAYDQMMQLRPAEGIDPRLLIVEITDADVEAQKQNGDLMKRVSTSAQTRGQSLPTSLSDRALQKLITLLSAHKPRVIGLDMLRDFPVEPERVDLRNALQTQPIVGICKAEDFNDPTIASIDPPPEIPLDRIGFNDFQPDGDGILRRHFLSMYPPQWSPESRCNVNESLSVRVVFTYLHQQGILAKFIPKGDHDDLQLGDRVFPVLRSHNGGYQKREKGGGGNQILFNVRVTPEIATRISLTDILKNQINPDYIKNKIILIGGVRHGMDQRQTTAEAGSDKRIAGVIVHAQLISQLLSAALDQRPLLRVWSAWSEIFWIFGWSCVGSILVWQFQLRTRPRLRSLPHWAIGIIITISLLYGVCFTELLAGTWIPFAPALIALILSSSVSSLYLIYKNWRSHFNLKS